MYANSDDRHFRERIWKESQPSVIDKQRGRNVFNPYPTIPPIGRKNREKSVCCNCCFKKTGIIIFGIGVGVVFILLGFTVYFFLSCINERLPEPELAAENIYINAKNGNINSAETSSISPRPVTTPPDGVNLNYYPVLGGRRRRQADDRAGDRYDRHGRALAPSCISPLLALVSTAAICFIAILMILCYLSNVVDS